MGLGRRDVPAALESQTNPRADPVANINRVHMTTFALARPSTIRSRENGYLQRVTFESSDDAVLVARITRGDESALEAIYRRYGGAVAFVARKVLRDEALAEDVQALVY